MFPIIIFIITFMFLAIFRCGDECDSPAPIRKKEKIIFMPKKEISIPVYKSDGSPVVPILRKTMLTDKPKKSVSFNDERQTLVGNRLKIEKTFNKNTDSK